LATVLRVSRKEISTIVAGRTDSGVHAIGQVAHAELADSVVLTPSALALLAKRVNGALRTDAIVVHSIDKAPEGFNARFSALARHYEYRLADRRAQKNPLKRDVTAVTAYDLDVAAMSDAAQALLGLHDFQAFCRPRAGATTIRTLQRFDWERDSEGVLVAQLSADVFLPFHDSVLGGFLCRGGAGNNDHPRCPRCSHKRQKNQRVGDHASQGFDSGIRDISA